jgi:hypothetical protein
MTRASDIAGNGTCLQAMIEECCSGGMIMGNSSVFIMAGLIMVSLLM